MSFTKVTRLGAAGILALLMSGGGRAGETPAAPSDLICTAQGLDVFLAWTNNGDYSQVKVRRGKGVVATLPGTAEAYSETVPAAGAYAYSIVGFPSREAATCRVEAVSVPQLENLACTFSAREYHVLLAWSAAATASFDAFTIARDGVRIGEVGGLVRQFVDAAPPIGSHAYEVRGVVGASVSAPRACTVAVTALASISSFAAAVDAATGAIVLTWTNGEAYDAIELACGGEALAVLGGGATTYTFTHESFGIYEFEARASLGVRQTEAAACAAATGRLIWDADPVNAAAGYHVYLWSSAAAAPAVTDYVYTTGAVTALPLADLLAAGALPENRDPVALNVALTAFDAAGNLSALSESVGFDWQVLSADELP